jgi:hypothetical protein
MSEGPKLYTNKPKKGKLSQNRILCFCFNFSLINCLCYLQTNSTTETISRATPESQGLFFTFIISNGDSVFSSATSATTKRVICSPLQVSLAYAFGCQSCCWRSFSFSFSSILSFLNHFYVYLIQSDWIFKIV